MITELVKNWLIKANNDILISINELELPENKIVTDGVCFHCQQAVEKFFKAYLISKEIEFPKTHNLELLQQLCTLQFPDFKKIELSNLSDFAVDVRYGSEFYLPSIQEAKESFELASNVKKFVLNILNVKEEDLKI
ncbi:MAG: HEPN domain-containing protein [bacterium]